MACMLCIEKLLAEMYDVGDGELYLYKASKGELSDFHKEKYVELFNRKCTDCADKDMDRITTY